MLFFSQTAFTVGLLLLRGAIARPECTKVIFTVTATAENTVYADLPDPNDSAAISKYLVNGITYGPPTNGTVNMTETYDIVGTYCQPSPSATAHGALQYLVHGATYNQTVWTGLGLSDEYNWVLSATSQGYHTLTVDSLGHGQNPDRPDPFSVVQSPLQAEINHQILSDIRDDDENPLQQTFGTIILVSHSYGSSVSVNLLRSHPTDVEAFVMTGWSTSLSTDATIALDYVPGVDAHPDRLGGLSKGYVTQRTEKSRQGGFYAGDFDPSVPPLDYRGADTVGVAEILSLPVGLNPAPEYKGHVFAVTGDKDVLVCNSDFGQCDDILNTTGSLFPVAESYQYHAVPETGHDLSLHHSAPDTVALVHEWLRDTVL